MLFKLAFESRNLAKSVEIARLSADNPFRRVNSSAVTCFTLFPSNGNWDRSLPRYDLLQHLKEKEGGTKRVSMSLCGA